MKSQNTESKKGKSYKNICIVISPNFSKLNPNYWRDARISLLLKLNNI